jgi:hypothetical protein
LNDDDEADKHSLPDCVEAWLRDHPDTFAVLMVRDPFENLLSSYNLPYHFGKCFNVNETETWLDKGCKVSCQEQSFLKRELAFKSAADLWTHFLEGHNRVAQRYRNRAILVQYEEFLLNPEAVADRMVEKFGLQMDGAFRAETMQTNQKPEEIGREGPGYAFNEDQVQTICARLKQSQVTRRLNYLQGCGSS